MNRKDKMKYVLAEILREIESNRKREKEEEKMLAIRNAKIAKEELAEEKRFKVKKIKRIYKDHKVDIEWKREEAEA